MTKRCLILGFICFFGALRADWTFYDKEGQMVVLKFYQAGPLDDTVIDAIESLFTSAFALQHPDLAKEDFEFEKDALKENRDDVKVILARQNGVPVGFVLWFLEDGNELCIDYIAIEPSFWHRGMGSKLLFAPLLLEQNISKVYLNTWISDVSTCTWYKYFGFEPCTSSWGTARPEMIGFCMNRALVDQKREDILTTVCLEK